MSSNKLKLRHSRTLSSYYGCSFGWSDQCCSAPQLQETRVQYASLGSKSIQNPSVHVQSILKSSVSARAGLQCGMCAPSVSVKAFWKRIQDNILAQVISF